MRLGIARSSVPVRCWENEAGSIEIATRYRAYRQPWYGSWSWLNNDKVRVLWIPMN